MRWEINRNKVQVKEEDLRVKVHPTLQNCELPYIYTHTCALTSRLVPLFLRDPTIDRATRATPDINKTGGVPQQPSRAPPMPAFGIAKTTTTTARSHRPSDAQTLKRSDAQTQSQRPTPKALLRAASLCLRFRPLGQQATRELAPLCELCYCDFVDVQLQQQRQLPTRLCAGGGAGMRLALQAGCYLGRPLCATMHKDHLT